MNHLGLIILIVFCFEIFCFFKLKEQLFSNSSIYKELWILMKSESLNDEVKQVKVFELSKKLFITSIKILLTILLIFIPILISKVYSENFYNFIFSLTGIIESFIIIIFFINIRKIFSA